MPVHPVDQAARDAHRRQVDLIRASLLSVKSVAGDRPRANVCDHLRTMGPKRDAAKL